MPFPSPGPQKSNPLSWFLKAEAVIILQYDIKPTRYYVNYISKKLSCHHVPVSWMSLSPRRTDKDTGSPSSLLVSLFLFTVPPKNPLSPYEEFTANHADKQTGKQIWFCN